MKVIHPDGNGPFSLPTTCKQILKDKNPFDYGILDVSKVAQQILLSNHIDEAYKLIVAIAEFDAQWSKINKTWDPLGLNIFKLSLTAESFFASHPTYQRPPQELVPMDVYSHIEFDHKQKYMYGQSTESLPFWMEFHRNEVGTHVPDFDSADLDLWKTTDDPFIISYCFYSNLNNPELGQPPSKEACKQALPISLKLYSLPNGNANELAGRRHWELVPRTTAMAIAIRASELEIAADIFEIASKLEGLGITKAAGFLQIPGIYDVLPILAKRGTAANKHYINAEDTATIVRDFKEAMTARLAAVPQSGIPKVDWKNILNRLAVAAWTVHGKSYRAKGFTCSDDVLFPPATEQEIIEAENLVGPLPEDLKQMVRVSNGFKGGWHFLCGGMAGIANIGFGNDVKYWSDNLQDQGFRKGLKESGNLIVIQPGSECDGYAHYLIPPALWKKVATKKHSKDGKYLYFQWSSWDNELDDDHVANSVTEWVLSCVDDLETMVEKGESDEDEDLEGSDNDIE